MSPSVARIVAGAVCGVVAAAVLTPLHARQLADVAPLEIEMGGTGRS